MAAVSVVIFYGQKNLDRFNGMAEYWRRAMLPEELKRTFFLSATDKHMAIEDAKTAELFREQCRRLKRPDEISSRLIETMLSMVTTEGIQLHVVCGGDDAWDPGAPLRMIARLRSAVKPTVVTPYIYMMAEESVRAQQQQRAFAQALKEQLTGYSFYLLSRKNEVGRLLNRFDMDRALTCEILLRMRGNRQTHQAGAHIYTLGYKSLNAFDGELEMLRRICLRDAALEQHREAIHNVDAWRMLMPSGEEWKRFFHVSDDWRGRYEPQKKCDINLEAWHSALPDTVGWEQIPPVDAPDMGNSADVQERVRQYLTAYAKGWVKRCNEQQLENMRILGGMKGQESGSRMMKCVSDFYGANMSDGAIKRKIEIFCDVLVQQFSLQLCGLLNASKYPDGVVNAVIAALDKLALENVARPSVMDPKVGMIDKVRHGMDGWKKYLQQLAMDASARYHEYRVQTVVVQIASALKDKLRTDALVFLQQLRKSDEFSWAAGQTVGNINVPEGDLMQKYNGYWTDVSDTLHSRQNIMGWPFGPYAGGNDSARYVAVYSREAVWNMVDYAKKAAADHPVSLMEQEHNLDMAKEHLGEFLRQTVSKESKKLHDEQSVAYSGTFIKALREMNPQESNMDDFLNHYLVGGSRMLCMIHCVKTNMIDRDYFVDNGLENCDWARKHSGDVLAVHNDNIEQVDLYPVQEDLQTLLGLQDNTIFGDAADADENAAELLTESTAAYDDDGDEQWRAETQPEPVKAARPVAALSKADGRAESSAQTITHQQKGNSEMIHWPAPTDVNCGPATICVSQDRDSRQWQTRTVSGVSSADIADMVAPGVNFVQIRYHGAVHAEGEIHCKLQSRTYAIKLTDKGRVLYFRAPGDSHFVLRDGNVRYPIGRSEDGTFGPLRIINVNGAAVEEFSANPKYQLKRDDNM